ncbi:MAG: error-prone DNA polymerase [Rhodobacteraceae bacterium]|nr:error-prone DNA polymerase [Paracoccaceae bacterium]
MASAALPDAPPRPRFAELSALSNFTFLTGGSHPEELMERAALIGYPALAVADVNSVAGIVRAHTRAREIARAVQLRRAALERDGPIGPPAPPGLPPAPGLDLLNAPRLIPAAQIVLTCGFTATALPGDRAAWGRLCRLLSAGRLRAPKGGCELHLPDLLEWGEGMELLLHPPGAEAETPRWRALVEPLAERFPGRVRLLMAPLYDGQDAARLDRLAALAAGLGLETVASALPIMHHARRRRLCDVLTAIRTGTRVDRLGRAALANGERRLRSEAEMRRLFAGHEAAVDRAAALAEGLTFSLDELSYQYPSEIVGGETPAARLARLARAGLDWRYPGGVPDRVRGMLERELALIARLRYEPYFLTVHDIVAFARARGILCQGRGSAANSVVCYALGITSVSPEIGTMVFERFVSEARDEPPDIDVDFEHERREEVIQHIYEKYGRHRAGLCATVIHYRGKRAVREVGKAMGLSEDTLAAMSSQIWGFGSLRDMPEERLREIGLDPADPRLACTLELIREIQGFPRHLSQHVGGFVITEGRLDELVPVENATMEDRTVIPWDKDDIDSLRILKVDILALGMLSCLRRAFDLIRLHRRIDYTLATLPPEDPATYDMLCKADSLGVFQVESRAQMNFLPRMKPRCFYDLVIQVAIIRPGPIQGDMVHPFIRRRNGQEPVSFPSDELGRVLGKTLGVPLFQEQAMKIAIVAAGFTPAQADGLRRAMAAFRRHGHIERYQRMLIEGMVARGYERDFAERCFRQIEGFGYYGFPESHAASFALLVYVSAWLKCHYPDVFCAAIVNSQPMGFYANAQLVRDARDHGVELRPPDVQHSFWDSTLEPLPRRRGPLKTAVRLGLREIKGFRQDEAERIAAGRPPPYRDLADLQRRCGLARATLLRLAEADALRGLGLDRRQGLWAVHALKDRRLPLFDQAEGDPAAGSNQPPVEGVEPWLELPAMPLGAQVIEDYATLRLSLKAHPLALLREHLPAGVTTARGLWSIAPGRRVTVAGLVLVRQRPGSAKGVIFTTLEDETGFANCIVWPAVFESHRAIVMTARLLAVRGRLQREGKVVHVVAERLVDWTGRLRVLREGALDPAALDGALARADEVRREGRDLRDALPEGRNFR